MIAILRTTEYRGDHSADVSQVFLVHKGETVKDLMARLKPNTYDWIELRHTVPAQIEEGDSR